ncbi:SDR family NAD(P)-dependent oxidoreductase [Maribacter sp. MAR_2009_72]|uniref:SDR family NAD(P)-dependent oxidoreductase n=1 Tax=Maribacter sp. MAR_2009_72 TaxID=1250050 RepID=UPI001199256D|nr:SDR family oxidoreductase [Maribacter sp. MAR_2009_72]TVZ14239.1 NAD(P)-dependent dehydrogenase (short-subunit alcohol dehydrogenase family) [Maribacter sp. MAR_2009_72]
MEKRKIALVTGGSRGLGKEMALRIAEKGLDVILTFHSNEDAAKDTVRSIEDMGQKAIALQLDTRKVAEFDTFFKNISTHLKDTFQQNTFDYLINNAGTGIYKPFLDTTESDFDEMMNIHIKGVYFLTQHAVPLLTDGGGIINISSGLARFSLPGSSAYASMKGAVDVFTRYLAKELSNRKIRANVVAPGAVATDFGGGENKENDKKRALISQNTALGRVGEPEDIGGIVAFLCTEDSCWINGQRIEASGGIML